MANILTQSFHLRSNFVSLNIDNLHNYLSQDVEFVMKQLMYEISLLEKEPQWVPAKWVKVIIVTINSHFTLKCSFRIYTNIEIKENRRRQFS